MAIRGVMSTTGMLTTLGNDVPLTIAFRIGDELLLVARDAGLDPTELIGVVLLLSIVLSELIEGVLLARAEIAHIWKRRPSQPPVKGTGGVVDSVTPSVSSSSIFAFAAHFVELAQRLSLAVCVQLIAGSVQLEQPVPSVRIVSLLGVAVFFIFVQKAAVDTDGRH